MLNVLLSTTFSFFDTTPIGRILGRFGLDIMIMDNLIPRLFDIWSYIFFFWTTTTLAVCIFVPILIPLVIILYIITYVFYKY